MTRPCTGHTLRIPHWKSTYAPKKYDMEPLRLAMPCCCQCLNSTRKLHKQIRLALRRQWKVSILAATFIHQATASSRCQQQRHLLLCPRIWKLCLLALDAPENIVQNTMNAGGDDDQVTQPPATASTCGQHASRMSPGQETKAKAVQSPTKHCQSCKKTQLMTRICMQQERRDACTAT